MEASNSWNLQDLFRPVMGLLYRNIKVGGVHNNHCTVKGRRLLLRPETSTLEQQYRIWRV